MQAKIAPDGTLLLKVPADNPRYRQLVESLFDDEQPHDTKDLAELYAEMWHRTHPYDVGHHELATAHAELHGGTHGVNWDGDKWHVSAPPRSVVESVLLEEVRHAPKGEGITIKGKHFKPGQFIPLDAYKQATPDQKAAIDKPAEAAATARKARGSVDHDKLASALAPHAHHELTVKEKLSAKRSFNALHRHHGDLVVHRLEEIAGELQKAHDREGNTEGQTEQYSRRLRAVQHQVEMAKEKGLHGDLRQHERVTAEEHPGDGSIVEDGSGKQFVVIKSRHGLVTAAPIVDGKAKFDNVNVQQFVVGENRGDPVTKLYKTGRNYHEEQEAKKKAAEEKPKQDNNIVREIGSLSSGTLANLFGTGNMAEIDQKAADWQQWAGSQPGKFETWQDAWEAYKPVLDANTKANVSKTDEEAYADATAKNLAEMKADPGFKGHEKDPGSLNYNVVLKSLADVMNRDKIRTTTGDLATRWHYPLASFKPSDDFGKVVKGMSDVAEMSLKDESGPYEARSSFLNSSENTHGKTADQLTRTLNELGKQFQVVNDHASSLELKANDLTSLGVKSDLPQQLHEKAKNLRDRVALKEHNLNTEITRQAEVEQKAAEEAERASQFRSDLSGVKIPKVNTKKIVKMVSDGKMLPTAAATGYATDGRFIVKLNDKDKAKVEEEAKKVGDQGGRKLSEVQVSRPLSEKHNEPAKIIGVRETDDAPAPVYLMQGEGKQQALVDSRFHQAILSQYPDAVPHMPVKDGGIVIYKNGGEPVGAVVSLENDRAWKGNYKVDDTPYNAPPLTPNEQGLKDLTDKAKPTTKGGVFTRDGKDVIGDSFGHFGITQLKDEDGKPEGWGVVHIPSGSSVGSYDTKRDASFAAIVTQAGGKDSWQFTDPKEITAGQVKYGKKVRDLVDNGEYAKLASLLRGEVEPGEVPAEEKPAEQPPATSVPPEGSEVSAPVEPSSHQQMDALAKEQAYQANVIRKRQGLAPLDFELKEMPVSAIKPSQSDEDYDNPSSRELAKHIGQFMASGRKEDYAPAAVDENMKIIDGNHRHAARVIAGIKTMPVLVPKGVEPEPSPNYANAVTIAADSVGELRKHDVHRVMDSMQDADKLKGMGEYITANRPDLQGEVDEAAGEIAEERGYGKKEPAKAKEPWEMTAKEYIRNATPDNVDQYIKGRDGEPLVVYQGSKETHPITNEDLMGGEAYFRTKSPLDDKTRIEPGVYFSPDKEVARKYGTPIPYYLKANRTIRDESPLESWPEGADSVYRTRGKGDSLHDAWEIATRQSSQAVPVRDVKVQAVGKHYVSVAAALAAGKPVPPEVLADYPDLAEKYGKAADVVGDTAPVEPPSMSASVQAITPEKVTLDELARRKEEDAKQQERTDAGTGRGVRGSDGGLPVANGGGNLPGGAGGNAGPGGDPSARPRIITTRGEFTQAGNPELVPEALRGHLNEAQQHGVSLAIDAMQKHGGFLLADGTGVGKTRAQLAVAQHFVNAGKKVVIVSPSEVIKPNWTKGTMAGSFADDSAAMGIKAKLVKGDVPLGAGTIHITTYNELGKLKDHVDKDTVVIFDESHFMKNYTSSRYKHGKDVMDKAAAVMYATATPGDKPLHIAHLAKANVFGNAGKKGTYEKLGMRLVDQRVHGGGTVKCWQIDPRVGYKEAARRLSGLFDQMTKDGLMIKREMSMDRVHVGLDRVDLSNSDNARIMDIYDKKMKETDNNKAVSLMAARMFAEPLKIPHTVSAIQEELAAGRVPVVFVGRVNDIEDDDENGEKVVESSGTTKALKEALIAAGVPEDQIGELHGGATKNADQKKKSMNDFQSGKKKVMIATIQSGGTGINLDDTIGNKPRSIIMVTPPFTANDMAQAIGRVNRLNTKSDVRVRGILANNEIDDWNAGILERKFQTLGAIVGGNAQRGMAAIGYNAEDPDNQDSFDWGESLRPSVDRTPAANAQKVYHNTPYHHNDVIGQFGGKRVKRGNDWTTAFPSQEHLDKYKEHVKPKKQPAAAAPEPVHTDEPHISEEQREAIHNALKILAGNDPDKARERNNIGFNSMDAHFGASLADAGRLTDRQAAAGAKILAKYHRQVPEDVLKKATTFTERPKPVDQPKQAETQKVASVPTKISVSGNTFAHKERIKAAGGRWDSSRGVWVIPYAAKEKLQHLSGLRFSGEQVMESIEQTHEFASTQFNLADDADVSQASKVRAMAARIADADLAEGRESEPHITALYGLHGQDPADVAEVVREFGPVTVRFGATSAFPGEDHDVVMVQVFGDDIYRLNNLLRGSLAHTETHSQYVPHVTLAYVKPGLGEKYAGMMDLFREEATFGELVFSDKEGEQFPISLLAEEDHADVSESLESDRPSDVGPFIVHQFGKQWKITHAGTGLGTLTAHDKGTAVLAAKVMGAKGDWSFADTKGFGGEARKHGREVMRAVMEGNEGELQRMAMELGV